MITINPNFNIYFTGERKSKHASLPQLKQLTEDRFERKASFMTDKRYQATNKNLNVENIVGQYRKKIRSLPLIMDRAMFSAGGYLSGLKSVSEFADTMLDCTDNLVKRIELSEDGEEYAKNYAPELTLIRTLAPLCNDFKNGNIQKQELDAAIEKSIQEYLSDNTTREMNFIK